MSELRGSKLTARNREIGKNGRYLAFQAFSCNHAPGLRGSIDAPRAPFWHGFSWFLLFTARVS